MARGETIFEDSLEFAWSEQTNSPDMEPSFRQGSSIGSPEDPASISAPIPSGGHSWSVFFAESPLSSPFEASRISGQEYRLAPTLAVSESRTWSRVPSLHVRRVLPNTDLRRRYMQESNNNYRGGQGTAEGSLPAYGDLFYVFRLDEPGSLATEPLVRDLVVLLRAHFFHTREDALLIVAREQLHFRERFEETEVEDSSTAGIFDADEESEQGDLGVQS